MFEFDMKSAFFDQKKVIDAMDVATRRSMIKSLAKVRRRLIRTYRRGKKASAPGQPPRVHSRSRYANLKNVLFAYDTTTQQGVVGSVKLPRSKVAVPGLLEGGGIIKYNNARRRGGAPGKPQVIHIKPRPAVGPALKQSIESGEIVQPFANSVRG